MLTIHEGPFSITYTYSNYGYFSYPSTIEVFWNWFSKGCNPPDDSGQQYEYPVHRVSCGERVFRRLIASIHQRVTRCIKPRYSPRPSKGKADEGGSE